MSQRNSHLRTAALRARRTMGDEQRQSASRRIQHRFLNSAYFYRAGSIGCYFATPDEVDATQIFSRAWRAGKSIFAPVLGAAGDMSFHEVQPDTRLRKNRYGLWEPQNARKIAARELDVVITPTVAFDTTRNRIGMGGGYYDRCFAFLKTRKHWRKPKLLGFAFDCQRVEKITPNPWDIRLSDVFTESR